MSTDRLDHALHTALDQLAAGGRAKGDEHVIEAVLPAAGGRGPRYTLAGEDRPFLRMNSNGYLGLALHPEVIHADALATERLGAGPQAVRFISGTYSTHVALEQRLAAFHGREVAMTFSSAYAAVVGVLAPLITEETVVVADELNHNSIYNAIRLARPALRVLYRHGRLERARSGLRRAAGQAARAVIITDGVFSMRGDHAPLEELRALADEFADAYPEGVLLVVDDSHGVAALGESGRGTEEACDARADLLIATLGKAFGVNGGYVAGSATVIRYLRETAPLYVYSNPITPGEAAAATRAVEIVDSAEGHALLARLRALTLRFRDGITRLGYETIPGEHPIVPLMVRDSARTADLVSHLWRHGILATGLNSPVVPRGDEEIRFQVSAGHTEADIDEVLDVLGAYPGRTAR
ncbi:MAG: aminotransferase class I/II-fold pyridoxal phosphate-dependent enzyme [Dehalococcoidia bacterium]